MTKVRVYYTAYAPIEHRFAYKWQAILFAFVHNLTSMYSHADVVETIK